MTDRKPASEIITLPAIYDLSDALRFRAWAERANCRGMNPDLFFPVQGDVEGSRRARRVCYACEVRAECLDYATTGCVNLGIWGGMTEMERANERRQRRAQDAG